DPRLLEGSDRWSQSITSDAALLTAWGPDVATWLGPGLAMYLGLSVALYESGEASLPGRRLRHFAWLVGAPAAAFALALGLDAVRAARVPWSVAEAPRVSADGRLLLVHERRTTRPRYSRLSIVDIASGQLVGQARLDGVAEASWLPEREKVVAHVKDFSLARVWGWAVPTTRSWCSRRTAARRRGRR